VPPAGVTVADPVHAPLHNTFTCVPVVVSAVGCVIVTVDVVTQLLLSVTVTVYVPAARPVTVFDPATLLVADIFPLAPAQE
jgi:hypothetical protein